MTNTVIGALLSADGAAYNGLRAWETPAGLVRDEQPTRIPVDIDHSGAPVGEVKHLERDGVDGGLWCIAEVDDSVRPAVSVRVGEDLVDVPHPLYFSVVRTEDPDDGQYEITSVALTAYPARLGARPVQFLEGDLSRRSSWTTGSYQRGLLHRAAEAAITRHGRALTVHAEPGWSSHRASQPAGGLRRGPPGKVLGVR